MTTLDSANIWGFLQTHQTISSHSALTHPVESGAMSHQDLYDDQQSQASTCTHESYYTVAPSSIGTSAPTVFSRPRTGAPSTISTAPSRGRLQNLAQPFVQPPPEPRSTADNFVLWCEFRSLTACNTIFRGDDVGQWIQHHIRQHFGDRFPERSICWFCPMSFVAKHKADRQATWQDRMEHIAAHIGGDYHTPVHTRPDFHMLDHLHKHRLVDEETYRAARSYTELPPELRHPDVGIAGDMTSASLRRRQPQEVQYHNLDRENREQRRNQRRTTTTRRG